MSFDDFYPMQIDKEFGQLFMCGFHGLEPSPEILDLIKNHNLGSVILFSRNIESPEQVRRLTKSLQEAAREAGHKRPLFIAVDQENGVVRRLGRQSGTYLPGSMSLGALGSSTTARDVATAVSRELLALGINWNLAPVLDVNNNPLNPVIGVRSYGQDPELVARLGLAQIEGYHKGRVATSVKHFPGHGDTETDSHLGLPVIDKSLKELEKTELLPFRRAVEARGLAQPTSVMVGHMALPQIVTTQGGGISSLAREVVYDLLRTRMNYGGLIITDCLEMDAVKASVGTPQGALMALQAGNDMVMISHTYELQKAAFTKVFDALLNDQLNANEIALSLERMEQFKDRFLTWDSVLATHDLNVVGCAEHARLSKELYDRTPTLVRNSKNVIPIRPSASDRILFLAAHVPMTLAIDSEKEPFNSFHEALVKHHKNVEYVIYNENSPDMSDAIQSADWVIVGTANANLHPFQVRMVKQAQQLAKRLIVTAIINPYEMMCFPDIDTYIVTYEYTPPAHEAAVRLIFGEITTHSQLPVTIPNVSTVSSTTANKYWMSEHQEFHPLVYVSRLWDKVFGKTWPLGVDKIITVLETTNRSKQFIAWDRETGNMIGYAVTQIVRDGQNKVDQGELVLLMVDPEHRNRGVGSMLHDAALEHLRTQGVSKLKLGSTYPRFFPGIPQTGIDVSIVESFFRRRGWVLSEGLVWDLKGDVDAFDLLDYNDTLFAMDDQNIWIGRIKPDQLWELYAFQQRYFPYWLSTYQHHAGLGDFQDIWVARDGGKDGRIVASLILYTTGVSHMDRTDLIWQDDQLFGTASGGISCVGVAEEERGRGIGLAIVARATHILQERRVDTGYVDWVELVDFYRRVGYEPWRSYRLGTIE